MRAFVAPWSATLPEVRIACCSPKDGAGALDVISQNPVAPMLLDLRMPKMDGLAVLEKALKKWPGLKVIMLTGHGGVQEAVAAIKLGAMDFGAHRGLVSGPAPGGGPATTAGGTGGQSLLA
jgi:DNA-binding NtrC family response regulator